VHGVRRVERPDRETPDVIASGSEHGHPTDLEHQDRVPADDPDTGDSKELARSWTGSTHHSFKPAIRTILQDAITSARGRNQNATVAQQRYPLIKVSDQFGVVGPSDCLHRTDAQVAVRACGCSVYMHRVLAS
jgi:hypothetical protein